MTSAVIPQISLLYKFIITQQVSNTKYLSYSISYILSVSYETFWIMFDKNRAINLYIKLSRDTIM
jgi:hypothetical protein